MKTSFIFLALSLSTATFTLGQSSPHLYAARGIQAVRESAPNLAEDQPKFTPMTRPQPNFVLINPENGPTQPTNVVYTKTVNAAIYPVINSVKIRLAVENPARISLRYRLLNERGEVLYAQRLPRNCKVSMQYFDMERTRDGAYTVEISDGVNRWPLEFHLHSANVVVPDRVIALN